eukprot:COSAG01_NODE_40388_length_464_cov_1.082192_2_plen_62_part_01
MACLACSLWVVLGRGWGGRRQRWQEVLHTLLLLRLLLPPPPPPLLLLLALRLRAHERRAAGS